MTLNKLLKVLNKAGFGVKKEDILNNLNNKIGDYFLLELDKNNNLEVINYNYKQIESNKFELKIIK